jgi:hypothetical protein
MTLDADLRVVVSQRLEDGAQSAELACSLGEVHGRRLLIATRFPPALEALEHHRERIFQV